ncbi:hypothetical protein ACSBR2_016352 [Camellia fascicularis]
MHDNVLRKGINPCSRAQQLQDLIQYTWLKSMVAKQNFDHLVDPKMPEMISLKELKRIILIALRCVDPDVENRPRMGDVIHMFEPCDLLLSDVIAQISCSNLLL